MKILVTGGLGFLGSNLVHEGAERGHEMVALDNFSKNGSQENLKWLQQASNGLKVEKADIRSSAQVEAAVKKHKPDAFFHTAGQVAMTVSIENPQLDFEVNAQGTLNVLEAARKNCPGASVLFSSTNKVYGDLEYLKYAEKQTRYEAQDYPNGFDERLQLEFHSPYGCSKGAADQYLLDYHRIFGLDTVVFRHSSMYGSRQYATYDQGWVGWFVQQALAAKGGKKEVSISGNGKQVRDLLYATDMTELYFSCAEKIGRCAGEAFNIGGGMKNSMSLLELFSFLEKNLGVELEIEKGEWRKSDQKVFVADISKIGKVIGWKPKVSKEEGLNKMVEWCESIKSK